MGKIEGYWVRIECDMVNEYHNQDAILDIAAYTKSEVNRQLNKSGWVKLKGKWICLKCQNNEK